MNNFWIGLFITVSPRSFSLSMGTKDQNKSTAIYQHLSTCSPIEMRGQIKCDTIMTWMMTQKTWWIYFAHEKIFYVDFSFFKANRKYKKMRWDLWSNILSIKNYWKNTQDTSKLRSETFFLIDYYAVLNRSPIRVLYYYISINREFWIKWKLKK